MAGRENRKQELARRLRVSERVLEQYLEQKKAEAGEDVESLHPVAPDLYGRVESRASKEKRV